MVTTRTPSDDLNMALLPLLLELLEAPEQLQEFALVGVLCTLHISVQGRPAVAARALELGVLAALMRCMQQVREREEAQIETPPPFFLTFLDRNRSSDLPR